MPINIEDSATLAEKYANRAGGAVQDYTRRVQAPRRSQSEEAIKAKDIWKESLDAAAGRGAYEKGLRKSGDAKWQRKALEVGAKRYKPGIEAAKGDWASGVDPYLQNLRTVDLGAKGIKGSPENLDRVKKVVEAQRALKIARG